MSKHKIAGLGTVELDHQQPQPAMEIFAGNLAAAYVTFSPVIVVSGAPMQYTLVVEDYDVSRLQEVTDFELRIVHEGNELA